MPTLPIVRLGHPALRTPAQPVDPERLADPELQQLIDDLFTTMEAAGGVGLAAPQVGLGLRLFVYAVPPAEDDGEVEESGDDEAAEPEPIGRAIVNPQVDFEPGDLEEGWEGCLSIPDLRGLVPRYPAARVRALDRHGKPLDYRAEGFEARIVQHELDHLDGVIFLDRMSDLQSLTYPEEWRPEVAGK